MLITKRILVLFCFFFLSSIINSSNSEDVQVGFGNHTLKDGKVTLAIGTRIAKENDFKDNKGHLPACVASIKGNQITLLYNEKSEEGCTVDLLTNVTYIELDANLNFCVKIEGKAAKRENFDNYKILPFAYSLTNKELNKIWDENATCSERSSCLKNKEIKANCMPWTAMKITWELNTTHLSVCLTLLGTNEYVFENSTIKVNNSSTSVKYHVSIHKNKDGGTISQYNYKAQTSSNSVFSDMKFKCIDKSALKPKTWEIDGGTYNGQQMFTFNLLPRTKINSSKKFIESPNQCENITIVLSSEYKLLFVDKATLTKDNSLNTSSTTLSTTTTTTTTTTTSSLSTTSTTTSTTTKPTTTTTSTTTKPTTTTTSTTTKPTTTTTSTTTTTKPSKATTTVLPKKNIPTDSKKSQLPTTLKDNFSQSTASINTINPNVEKGNISTVNITKVTIGLNYTSTKNTTEESIFVNFTTIFPSNETSSINTTEPIITSSTLFSKEETTTSSVVVSSTKSNIHQTTGRTTSKTKEGFPIHYYIIAGIVIGVIILLFICIVCCVIQKRKKKKNAEAEITSEGSGGTDETRSSVVKNEGSKLLLTQLDSTRGEGKKSELKTTEKNSKTKTLIEKEEVKEQQPKKEISKETTLTAKNFGNSLIGIVPDDIKSKTVKDDDKKDTTEEDEVLLKPLEPKPVKEKDPNVSTFSAPYEDTEGRMTVPLLKDSGVKSTESKETTDKEDMSSDEDLIVSDKVVKDKNKKK